MSDHKLSRFLLPLAIAALVAPVTWSHSRAKKALADESAAKTPVTETVKIPHPTVINGRMVQPDEYRMVAGRITLKVEDLKTNKVVAESPITWKQVGRHFAKTKMDIDRGILTKVDLGGTRESVLLHNSRS